MTQEIELPSDPQELEEFTEYAKTFTAIMRSRGQFVDLEDVMLAWTEGKAKRAKEAEEEMAANALLSAMLDDDSESEAVALKQLESLLSMN